MSSSIGDPAGALHTLVREISCGHGVCFGQNDECHSHAEACETLTVTWHTLSPLGREVPEPLVTMAPSQYGTHPPQCLSVHTEPQV